MNRKANELTVYDRATAAATLLLKDPALARPYYRNKESTLRWAAEKGYALQQILKNEYLAATVVSNPLSFVNAMKDLGHLGVSLSPTLSHAYLIPETIGGKATVTVSLGYKGLEHLVLSSKAVRSINTELVYTNDTFERGTAEDGTPYATFKMARGERGELEGGFCLSKLKNGERNVEWMTAEELEGCHAAATKKQKQDPFTWRGAFKGEMYKKCIVRRASKHWVLPISLVKAFTQMDALEPMDFTEDTQPIDAVVLLTPEHAGAIHEALRDDTMGDDHITVWMDRQAQAWGHKGLDSYPDDGWEKLRDALIERKQKITKLHEIAKLDATEPTP